MICRRCGRPIEVREPSPGMRVWAHVVNPRNAHHYPKPYMVRETEAEKREAYGGR